MARRTFEESLKTRARIMDSALAVFRDRGFSEPSLEEIASAAGVTRGAIYCHFEDKRDLLDSICCMVSWAPPSGQGPCSSSELAPPVERLVLLVRAWMHDLETQSLKRDVFDVLMHKVTPTDANLTLLRHLRGATESALLEIQQLVAEAESCGDLRLPINMSVSSTASTVQAALLGLMSTKLLHPDSLDLAAASEWVVRRLMDVDRVLRRPTAASDQACQSGSSDRRRCLGSAQPIT